MKRIVLDDYSDGLHVEMPGCVVVIDPQAMLIHEKQTTVIEIRPDNYAGQEWHLSGYPWKHGSNNGLHTTVIQGKNENPSKSPGGLLQKSLGLFNKITVDGASQETLDRVETLRGEIETLLHRLGQL